MRRVCLLYGNYPKCWTLWEDELNGISGGDDESRYQTEHQITWGSFPRKTGRVDIVGASDAWAAGYTGAGWYVPWWIQASARPMKCSRARPLSKPAFPRKVIVRVAERKNMGLVRPWHYPSTYTGYDHGTHVSGIAVGNSGSFFGVAKDADIVAIQVFSKFEGAACGGGILVLRPIHRIRWQPWTICTPCDSPTVLLR